MAKLLGFESSYVLSMLENGKRKPCIYSVLAYEMLFGIQPEQLIPELYQKSHQLITLRINKNSHMFSNKQVLEQMKKRLENSNQTNAINKQSMSNEIHIKENILSIYPTIDGFSFSYFEGRHNLVDWGNIVSTPNNFLQKLQKVIDYYKPQKIITEDYKGVSFRRGKRISSMLDDVYKITEQGDIELKKYSRNMVKGVFDCLGANNQYQTSLLLVQWYPSLSVKLPPEPKIWKWTHYRKGVFDSVSFAFSYFYTEG